MALNSHRLKSHFPLTETEKEDPCVERMEKVNHLHVPQRLQGQAVQKSQRGRSMSERMYF